MARVTFAWRDYKADNRAKLMTLVIQCFFMLPLGGWGNYAFFNQTMFIGLFDSLAVKYYGLKQRQNRIWYRET